MFPELTVVSLVLILLLLSVWQINSLHLNCTTQAIFVLLKM
jgi:hypothetical protein